MHMNSFEEVLVSVIEAFNLEKKQIYIGFIKYCRNNAWVKTI